MNSNARILGKNRFIKDIFDNDHERNELGKNWLKIGDYLRISPVHGKKKLIQLNRTKYNILQKKVFSLEYDHYDIILPGGGNDGDFLLHVCSYSMNQGPEEECPFILKSLSHRPFKINGTWTFEAIIGKGDIVDLGFNRLEFIASELQQRIEEDQVFIEDNIARSELNILIEGETGTGKTYLAKKIHEASGRAGNFVHINLSSFSGNLIESELFGHIKGSFTGACNDKLGAFREANSGTLFLDEIDSLPLEIQTKLLLFLDSKEVRPVGGGQTYKVDVRLIFASGRSLSDCVEKKEMRQDFYYRLATGVKNKLPSLRNNSELISSFCHRYAVLNSVFISSKLIDFYKSYSWPGNIRQLKGHLDKKIVLAKGRRLEFDKMDEELIVQNTFFNAQKFMDEVQRLEDVKKQYCQLIYFHADKNIKKSCEILDITPNTLRSILKKADVLAS